MTNITTEHRKAFEALTSGRFNNFALFSCFVNGEPAAAIVAVNRDGEEYTITQSKNESDIQNKRTALELARIDLEKYQKGDYLQTKIGIEEGSERPDQQFRQCQCEQHRHRRNQNGLGHELDNQLPTRGTEHLT